MGHFQPLSLKEKQSFERPLVEITRRWTWRRYEAGPAERGRWGIGGRAEAHAARPCTIEAMDSIANGLLGDMFKKLSRADIEDLARFLADPKRPDGTLCFQELQGFLFAVASSPELVKPSAWLPEISNDEDIGFKDETEAEQIMGLIMSLYNEINIAVLERSDGLPLGCQFQANVEDNFDEETAISQWSRGFMMGHGWLAEVWDEYLPDELDGEFGSTTMALSYFSSRRLAEMYHAEATTTPRHRRPRVPFTEYSEKVRELFPAALSSYAHIGRTISEVLADSRESDA